MRSKGGKKMVIETNGLNDVTKKRSNSKGGKQYAEK